jgi:hypothetical protein
MKNHDKKSEPKGKIVAFLTREEVDFIDGLSKDALFSTGHKLSRTDIIRAMIDSIKANDINGKGVSSKSGLEKKILCLMNIALPLSSSEIKEKIKSDDSD